MAYVKEELVVSPYTGKEEMFYSVYKYDGTGEFDFVASTYSKEEAYGKYYERALRCEKADERRAKEAEERKEKINQKIQKEAELRLEITQKAAEYLAEFETQRQEQIAKRRKELEEKEANPNKGDNANGTSDSWSKVSGNIDLKDSDYKGSKDVQRMREAMMHRKEDPNSEPMKNFFG